MNPQAEELNQIIQGKNQVIYDLLSEKGKNIFFPKKGILGQTAQAKGKKINATIGAAIEDDGTPMRLYSLERLVDLPSTNVFPYAPSYGRPDIREQWRELIYKKNPSLAGKEISLPVVTNALTHALSMTAYLFLNEGESILVSDLFWGNYNLIFGRGYNATIDKFSLFDGEDFNIKSFREKMMEPGREKIFLILNFPNNPSGYTPTIEEVKEIVKTIKSSAEAGKKIVVVMDDAYFGLVYEEGVEEESVFSYLADLHENVLAVKVDGPTKEDYVWGFRVGFITYGIKNGKPEMYQALESKTAGAVRGNISNACNLSQSLLLKAYTSDTYRNEKRQKYDVLKERYFAVKSALENDEYQKYFKAYPFNSGYFMCVKLKEGLDGEKIRQVLLEKYDTGIINMNNVIRVAFSSVAEGNIPKLFENLYNACKDSSS